MYFFFHLLTGLILGLFISDVSGDRRWVLPCTVGAVLPDLIDKFIGHVLFPVTIGYGRIYAHSLSTAMLILIIGVLYWKTQTDPGVFALGIGILSHDILDLMWRMPENWYYPLLGPFKGHLPEDYIFTLIMRELTNPFELLIALALFTGLCALVYREEIGRHVMRHHSLFSTLAAAAAFLLCIASGLLIGRGIMHQAMPEAGWTFPEELIISGFVLVLAAYVLWRWHVRLKEM